MAGAHETQLYCLADPTYYDTPGRLRDRTSRYALGLGEPADGWRREHRGLWTVLRPDGVHQPEQGWKLHVSAVEEGAEETLEVVARICAARRVAFKFLRGPAALRVANGKFAGRGSSGKFVTVYPGSEEQFLELAGELSTALDGRPGPYVLTDLRIGTAPVYARYGAFVELWCEDGAGRPVPALRDRSGALVPDSREPAFRLPAWVRLPEALRPHLAARDAAVGELPYRILDVLQFSNAGGIYLAERRDTGERVVLREARPYAGLDAAGADALTRLRRERWALERLAGLDCVPRLHEVRTVWEHTFLVQEHIEGVQLFAEAIRRYPLVHQDCTAEQRAEYAAWVGGVVAGLETALDALHARGVRFGDLHPANVVLRPDGSVVLVDFEYAAPLDDRRVPTAGAGGPGIPAGLDGAGADRHMLWTTWLMLLMPVLELADRDPGKLPALERRAREWFGLGPEEGPVRPGTSAAMAAAESVSERRGRELLAGPSWAPARRELAAGIHAGATPDRPDRLFPGDVAGFADGGTGVAHGAAGVLYALHRAGADWPQEYADWLVAALRRRGARPGTGGLYEGPLGTAVVLARVGRPEAAEELLERARGARPARGVGLFGGRAGAALARLRLAEALGSRRASADALADACELAAVVRGEAVAGLDAPTAAGLLYGLAGIALLHLRLYRRTGERWLLDSARTALERATAQCVRVPDGSVQVLEAGRRLAYLDRGSSGIALVVREFLETAELPGGEAFLADVRTVCAPGFVREPGLFRGRVGLTLALDRLGGPAEAVAGQVARLQWHLVARPEGLLVPGMRLRRFSADLHTGAAGALLGLWGLERGRGDVLDLLTLG
ncbi:class III lanthionine synthetase LanKC [Streptomyces sp. NRRL S-350]|uniref:class III lanthionine synthetase LanKC n=1 Tax=Streptomyces sp. NRRL S-350 TaxID=1463902 RepID=UPI0004C1604A|nr:class III lanthionine synthetase LanKC [Streptomyces sp. NRRL S-350]